MAASTTRARAIAGLILATALLYAQCGGSKTTTPTPIDPNPTPINPTPPPPVFPSASQIFVGAGDIGWNPIQDGRTGGQELTAKLVEGAGGGQVFTAGDDAYFDGTTKNFSEWYAPSWGRASILGRTRPTPGNHEFDTDPTMSGYFGYFGAAAGPNRPGGYYSFEVGDWHAIMLNSSIVNNRNGLAFAQEAWLKGDLAQFRTTKCTIAVFHFPLFTSGPNGNQTQMRAIWQLLYDANVDVIVNGHDHLYEVFLPQRPDGLFDPVRGIREFIVGTGGAQLYPFVRNAPNSDRRIANTYGVLKLTLGTGYEWQFIPVAGGQSDSGTGACH